MKNEVTCSNCGGKMIKVDDTKMKCENCGAVVKTDKEEDGEDNM